MCLANDLIGTRSEGQDGRRGILGPATVLLEDGLRNRKREERSLFEGMCVVTYKCHLMKTSTSGRYLCRAKELRDK